MMEIKNNQAQKHSDKHKPRFIPGADDLMKRYMTKLRDDNQKQYWDTMIKINRDSQAFRFAFTDFIEESEEQYEKRMSK